MNPWAVLKVVRKVAGGALVAFLLWMLLVNSPLWPDAAHAASATAISEVDTDPPKNKDHEPNALHHVMDDKEWELFLSFGPKHIHLPNIFGFQITKFMILELIAALLVLAVFIPLGKKMQDGSVPRGSWVNLFESFLTFIRDQIAKPSLGEHDADKYTPFLWTLFLFILFNNLLGMVPFGGSATASIYVTLGLALCVFLVLHGSAIHKLGFGKYVSSLWPHIDVPFPMGLAIKPLIFVLEWSGVLVRNVVLAVRLFANVFAGHMVLATLLVFIYAAKEVHPALWGTIAFSGALGIIMLSLLELFVAFLQAYIFTFLTALFMGMALHPEH